MADPDDSSEIASLAQDMWHISEKLAPELPQSAEAAAEASRLLQQIIEGTAADNAQVLQDVDHKVSSLQSVLEENQESVAQDSGQDPEAFRDGSCGDGSGNATLAPGADREMLAAYLDQQESVLPDIEEYILRFEKSCDPEALSELRRTLHTVKGESGVMGLGSIERVCHQAEDYVQETDRPISADVLLAFKDWFEETINGLRRGEDIPPSDALQAMLSGSQETAETGGETESSAKKAESAEDAPRSEPADNDDEDLSSVLEPVELEDPELCSDFITETQEHFEVIDENLMNLEKDPGDTDAVATIFRAFHTIKGTCGFLGLIPLSELAHKAENLLDEVRHGRFEFKGEVVDATFNAADMIKKMVETLSEAVSSGSTFVPDREMTGVLRQLYRILGMGGAQQQEERSPEPAGKSDDTARPAQAVQPEEDATEREPKQEHAAASAAKTGNEGGTQAPSGQDAGRQGGSGKSSAEVQQTMKIDADKIDLLLDTIGELVIVESIVRQDPAIQESESLSLERNLAQLTKITRSLQDMGMSMRMIPIEGTFRKMARLVRDLSRKSGKQIEFSMQGKETELDKAMVEKLGDPLIHLVRNAVDHGIESSEEERRAAGKSQVGQITLRAYHQGGSIHVEISDDGRGLDREKLAQKAIERGVITTDEGMTDEEVHALIFAPGFSTAKEITDVSGRGVGMDVVKSNIEALRGNIRIDSSPGQGSTFTLVLPLTMAIIEGMTVRLGNERYIVPLLSIIESFRPTRDMIATVTGRGETVPFRGRLLTLFRLSEIFGVDNAEQDPTRGIAMVVEDAGRQVALLVDELLGQNQTVIKSMGEAIGNIQGIAGASIMPDGTPGLIIDVHGLVKLATA
jgi:two-component system chemotaxis sensor kinase CheA